MTDQELAAYRASRNPPTPRSIGFGDVIAAATSAVGIQPCDQCERRKEKMNALTPPIAGQILGTIANAFGAAPVAPNEGGAPAEQAEQP